VSNGVVPSLKWWWIFLVPFISNNKSTIGITLNGAHYFLVHRYDEQGTLVL